MQAIYKIFGILKNGSKHSLNEMKGVRSIHAFTSKKKEHSCRPLIQIWQFCLIKWIWRGFGMFYFYMRRGLGMIIWSARCILCIYFDACLAMPPYYFFCRKNSRTCRKIQRNLQWFKRNHFQDSGMDTHRPVSSLTTHPICCVSCKKHFFFCKHIELVCSTLDETRVEIWSDTSTTQGSWTEMQK